MSPSTREVSIKLLLAAFVAFSSFSAFAAKTCFKNDGAYLAHVVFRKHHKSGDLIAKAEHANILAGRTVCLDPEYKPENGEVVSISAYHHVIPDVLKPTCGYVVKSGNLLVVANGTTFNFWCHDTTDF
jgi:hypothetical protein